VVQVDALQLPMPDASVDAILSDAPCSASGVLHRHPDAKFLHDAEDIQALSRTQGAIIQESLRILKADRLLALPLCLYHNAAYECGGVYINRHML